MLVETCSSIGQELTKTTKPTDIAVQLDGRKKSPSNSSKPCSPNTRPSPTMPLHRGVRPGAANVYNSSAAAASQISSLTAQYQLMYQQLLYQAELDYQRANTKSAAAGTAPAPLKPLCAMCSLTPGYNGQCIHTSADSNGASAAINPAMLAMLNPAAALNYSKLMGLSTEPATLSSQHGLLRGSSVSPPSAHDSRRSSASSNHTISPPSHLTRELQQPIDLARQRSPSPLPQKECHWVGAEGYCGKRFHSQDDLMSHLKYHVITCPNVPSERSRSRSPLKSYKDSNFNTTSSSVLSAKHRFNPYSLPEKHLTAAMLRHWNSSRISFSK